jgi:hypothetical protein
VLKKVDCYPANAPPLAATAILPPLSPSSSALSSGSSSDSVFTGPEEAGIIGLSTVGGAVASWVIFAVALFWIIPTMSCANEPADC